jgi:hypothetical protein
LQPGEKGSLVCTINKMLSNIRTRFGDYACLAGKNIVAVTALEICRQARGG